MINYPYFRLFNAYIQSRSQKQIDPFDESQIELRSNIFDIDFNKEINNGRYLVLADLARINHGFLTGFFSLARKFGFYPMVAGIAVKYRYRIPYKAKFTMKTKMIYVDEKWTYFETKFYYRKKLSSSIFARTGVVLNGKLLYTKNFEKIVKKKFKIIEKPPELVKCWQEVDSNFVGFD
tara:strand:- start:307 stop:840 length:534 start_codon:yes stop_codon:yes gene_type:complete